MAVFTVPVSLEKSASKPTAVLPVPVLLLYRALNPSAVLDEPLVSLKSENQPCAVLFEPVVSESSASTCSAALLPLPRSSPGFASASGATAKQASTDRMVVDILRWFFGVI